VTHTVATKFAVDEKTVHKARGISQEDLTRRKRFNEVFFKDLYDSTIHKKQGGKDGLPPSSS